MKILFLDVNQSETANKITKLNTYQQYGIALSYYNLGYDVTIGSFNKINYSPIKSININDLSDLNDYSIIFLSNYVLNFFGGVEIPSITKSFKLLSNYNGKIVYLLSDFEMKFKQFNGERFNYNDDFKIKQDIKIAVQTFNKELTEKYLEHKCIFYPIQYSIFYKNKNKKQLLLNEKKYDLIYCGSFRSGRREEKMKEYFFDNNINTALFGSIKLEQFKNFDYNQKPSFLGRFDFNEISEKNQSAYATIIIGDKKYNNHFVTMRIFEALRDDLIIFIDNDYDEEHKLFSDFHYVKNVKELKEKIELLKNNSFEYNKIINEQRNFYQKYTDELFEKYSEKILKEVLNEN